MVGEKTYWKCRKKNQCTARLITTSTGRSVAIRSSGEPEKHCHAPNPEEVEALRLVSRATAAAAEHADRLFSAVMRVVQEAGPSVQAHLPNRENLRKRICREALRNMPSNPTRIEDLE